VPSHAYAHDVPFEGVAVPQDGVCHPVVPELLPLPCLRAEGGQGKVVEVEGPDESRRLQKVVIEREHATYLTRSSGS